MNQKTMLRRCDCLLVGAIVIVRRLCDYGDARQILCSSLVAGLLSARHAFNAPAALVNALQTETNGDPFFIREVLLHLVEEGKILRDGRGWTAELSIEELGIPAACAR